MKRLSIIPAYGRDYKSKKEVEGSLIGNLDFQIADIGSPDNGRYINLPQIVEAGITQLAVRYAKLTKVHVVEVKKLVKAEPEKAAPAKEPGWYVQIIETATGKVEKEMGPMDERRAARVDSGASINLDHENFHTKLVEVKG